MTLIKRTIKFILLAALAFILYNYLYIIRVSEVLIFSYFICTVVVIVFVAVTAMVLSYEDDLLSYVYKYMFIVMPIVLLIRRYVLMIDF